MEEMDHETGSAENSGTAKSAKFVASIKYECLWILDSEGPSFLQKAWVISNLGLIFGSFISAFNKTTAFTPDLAWGVVEKKKQVLVF